ncbi:MepB family protein [Chishuiella changwenlii]|uniref:MepB family protein n=1 Tax=Chishuiella changwenlii TaxID=1434701 RepID=UPI002FD883F9
MINELQLLEKIIFKPIDLQITDVVKDKECEEYLGFNFKVNEWNIKFRKSKITPKKVGQFVTFWKRNEEKQTEPFHLNDEFDFYIIAVFDEANSGFFLFPKDILAKKQLISTSEKEGKRGYRVYPDWVKTENKQAEKTQTWQVNYFINLHDIDSEIIKKTNSILIQQ